MIHLFRGRDIIYNLISRSDVALVRSNLIKGATAGKVPSLSYESSYRKSFLIRGLAIYNRVFFTSKTVYDSRDASDSIIPENRAGAPNRRFDNPAFVDQSSFAFAKDGILLEMELCKPYSPILWPWVWVSSSTSDLLVRDKVA